MLFRSDPEFAGSDTFAPSRALAAAIRRIGPVDLLVAGRTTIDGETGQVPPQLAELLDLPLLTGVRRWELRDGRIEADNRPEGGAFVRVVLPVAAAQDSAQPQRSSA